MVLLLKKIAKPDSFNYFIGFTVKNWTKERERDGGAMQEHSQLRAQNLLLLWSMVCIHCLCCVPVVSIQYSIEQTCNIFLSCCNGNRYVSFLVLLKVLAMKSSTKNIPPTCTSLW